MKVFFDWHSADSRATGPQNIANTVVATYGTGGGNTPMIVHDAIGMASAQANAERLLNVAPCITLHKDRPLVAHEAICMAGNFVDRKTNQNGCGTREGASFTLNTVDRHAVAYSTENYPSYIVRRLMPIECGRLQGFPDGWGEIEQLSENMDDWNAMFWGKVYSTSCAVAGKKPQKSILENRGKLAAWHNGLHTDSAEYKMWGNGMALPNALFFVSRALKQISKETGKPVECLRLGSLFDGSGTMPLAATMCGARAAWASEIEPYPIAVTRTHLPLMMHLGSVTEINGANIEPVDIITFGSPCQDLSIAGMRAGLDGSRSGLFWQAIRIANEMLKATGGRYPRYVLWENVPGALSSNGGKDFETVLNALLSLRRANEYVRQPDKWRGGAGFGPVAYRLVNSQFWGIPQRRRRIYALCDTCGRTADEILFERPGDEWYFDPRVPQGKEIAGLAGDCYTWHDRMVESAGIKDGTVPINTMLATRDKKLGKGTGIGVGRPGDAEYTLMSNHEHGVAYERNPSEVGRRAFTLKIRSGCDGGGKGALIQTELSATLATHQDQTLFAPNNKARSKGE